MSAPVVDERMALALEAVELAADILGYISGDPWERECTEKERNRFDEIHHMLFPPPPPPPKKEPLWASRRTIRAMYGLTTCPICNRAVSKQEHAVSQHIGSKHAELIGGAASELAKKMLAKGDVA